MTADEIVAFAAQFDPQPMHLDEAAGRALTALVRHRLLYASNVEGDTAYEVAHEALIQGWAALRGWLDADLGRRVLHQRL